MDINTLTQTIIERRKLVRLTQADLADRAHVSRRTIIDFESGASDIGARRLMRILFALNLSLEVNPANARPVESELLAVFRDDDA